LDVKRALNSELRDDLSMFESSHEALVHFSLVWLVSSFMTRVVASSAWRNMGV
jgi:hypothetical protein